MACDTCNRPDWPAPGMSMHANTTCPQCVAQRVQSTPVIKRTEAASINACAFCGYIRNLSVASIVEGQSHIRICTECILNCMATVVKTAELLSRQEPPNVPIPSPSIELTDKSKDIHIVKRP